MPFHIAHRSPHSCHYHKIAVRRIRHVALDDVERRRLREALLNIEADCDARRRLLEKLS